MVKRPKLNEIFPTPFTYGLFTAMMNIEFHPVPWSEFDISGTELDIMFMARYGERIASAYASTFTDSDTGKISSQRLPVLARHLLDINLVNWTQLWTAYEAEYNPINNYDMTEIETHENHLTFGHTNERTLDTKSENTPRTEIETSGDFYGFNSSTGVPTGKSTVKGVAGTDKTEDTGTITDEEGGTNDDEGERSLTRSGNIGVTTATQMLTEHVNFWVWNYFDSVFADVCKYLAIPIY